MLLPLLPRRWKCFSHRSTASVRRAVSRLRLEPLETRDLLSGVWTPLTNLAPSPTGTGTMILLSDGTVMVQGGGISQHWYRLTPDAQGNYADGRWSDLASMHTPRLYYASNMLQNGDVLVEGGEYTNQGQVDSNKGELFNPVTNTWKPAGAFPRALFGDDPSEILPNGDVLTGYIGDSSTYLYNPNTNTWSQAATKLGNDASAEETWLKLPDGSILSFSISSSIQTGVETAQRYLPSRNKWVAAGTVPVALTSESTREIGPAFLLPDGRAFFIGSTGNTAFYSPVTNTWATGPKVPNGLVNDDGPGAMLPDGTVLFTADTSLEQSPTLLFDFNPRTNTITQVGAPIVLRLSLAASPAYINRMLVLPSGQVLLSDSTDQLWLYRSGSSPTPQWRPTIQDIKSNADGSFTLTGTQLNGLSEGAAYGDDAEMSSNYPIVRLVDQHGDVFYARTYDWSNTGVATGSLTMTVRFALPKRLGSGRYTLHVMANGISSLAYTFNLSVALPTLAVDAFFTSTHDRDRR